ncbi:MAG: YdeI/OmpD-associated family protein [Cytophagales bacterium]|nr:YdeI/OmpD-associated family protein [Cytophagales bacterium]
MYSQVDHYLAEGCGRCPLGGTPECKVHNWTKELVKLRSIVLECSLTEELKWGAPCYTFQSKNVAMIAAFKDSCVLSFFKGSLLSDKEDILTTPGENTQSARVARFTDLLQIIKHEQSLKALIYEAIEVEKLGLEVKFTASKELEYPEELVLYFKSNPELEEAFKALTPGRKRGYILHFSQAKQSTTRSSRIEKCIPKIMAGKGFQDR